MSHLEGGGAGAAVQAQQNDNGMMALDGHPGQLESFALEAFYTFLKTYSLGDAEEETQARPFYAQQLEQMRIEDSTNLFVDWAHFVDYNSAIADMVAQRFLRLEPSLRQAVLQFVKDIMPEYTQVRRPLRGGGQRARFKFEGAVLSAALVRALCTRPCAGRQRRGQGLLHLRVQPRRRRPPPRPQARAA